MAKTRLPYPPEFRRQMLDLVQAGRSPEELAREFEPTAQSIRNWVDLDAHVLSRLLQGQRAHQAKEQRRGVHETQIQGNDVHAKRRTRFQPLRDPRQSVAATAPTIAAVSLYARQEGNTAGLSRVSILLAR